MFNAQSIIVLALAGWYFIVAPYQKPDAPMSKWEVKDHYDTESDCQQSKHILALVISDTMKKKGQAEPDDTETALLAGECIEGDDPRLKQ
jgi:hypothetical protein